MIGQAVTLTPPSKWRHVGPSQQPSQEVVSQTQSPASQNSPAPQGGDDPHLHVPNVQTFAAVDWQLVHAAPPVPHNVVPLFGIQTLFWQQPVGHEPALHWQEPPSQN
jgi:hypothetical protein